MIPLTMIVINEFLEGASKVALAERHDPIEALVLNRPYEPFSMGVRIGRLKRRLRHLHSGLAQELWHVPAPLPITIADQHVVIAQQPVCCRQHAPERTFKRWLAALDDFRNWLIREAA
jgi:hypothetical protein